MPADVTVDLPATGNLATEAQQQAIIAALQGVLSVDTELTAAGPLATQATLVSVLAALGTLANLDISLSSLAAALEHVSIDNLPATQPVSATALPLPAGAATQATLAAVLTALASVPVTGTFWPATQPVSATSLPLPTGAATSAKQDAQTTALGTLVAQDATLAALTATQPSLVTGDTGQTAQVIVGARKELSVSMSTVGSSTSTAIDCSNLPTVSVNITQVASGATYTFQTSSDGATWTNNALSNAASPGTLATATTGAGVFTGSVGGRYFRISTTGLTSGTMLATVEATALPKQPMGISVTSATVQGLAAEAATLAGNPVRMGISDGANVRTPLSLLAVEGVFNPSGGQVMAAGVTGFDSGGTYRNASVAGGDAGQSTLLVAGSRKEVALSNSTAGASTTTAVDMSNFAEVVLHVTAIGVGTAWTFQTSSDNVNWISCFAQSVGASTAAGATTASSTGMWRIPKQGRYFRLSFTAQTSGTTTGVFDYSSIPSVPNLTISSGVNSIRVDPTTTAGMTAFQAAAVTTPALVVASQHKALNYNVVNPTASVAYLALYDAATAGAVTLGSTTPKKVLAIPAGGVLDGGWVYGVAFTSGLVIAGTTTQSAATAVATGLVVSLDYI